MAASPWIPLPSNDSTRWPVDGQMVWVRMRGWNRRPFKAQTNTTTAGRLGFNVWDDGTMGPMNMTVDWPDIDAWQPA